MKLEKKYFQQNKYNELVDYANSNNLIIVDKGSYYETEEKKEPVKTIEELKEEKIQELKKERDIYKAKTFVKDGYSLLDFEPFSCYNYFNLIRLKMGWTQKDLDKFDEEHKFIADFYDTKKAEIKNAKNQTTLKNIDVVFKKEE